MQTPPPLCEFEQWIDTEISELDKGVLQMGKEFDAELKERMERRRQAEAARKAEAEEREKRHQAKAREEREKKLERARRARAAMEENPDALRKGKWPRCTQ